MHPALSATPATPIGDVDGVADRPLGAYSAKPDCPIFRIFKDMYSDDFGYSATDSAACASPARARVRSPTPPRAPTAPDGPARGSVAHSRGSISASRAAVNSRYGMRSIDRRRHRKVPLVAIHTKSSRRVAPGPAGSGSG